MNTDGMTSVTTSVPECQALSLVRNLDMEYSHRKNSTETNFIYLTNLKNLELKVTFKKVEGYSFIVTGSLHKYFHGKNSNDFYSSELEVAKQELISAVKMDISEIDQNGIVMPLPQIIFPLSKLEVGINFRIDIDNLPQFLKDNLLRHKNKPFLNEDGLVFICKHENFHLKIYPKDNYLVRYEIVFLTRELRKHKIKTLEDLTEENLLPLFSRLKKEAAEIIFSDGINIHSSKNITRRQKEKLLVYTNDWWHNDFKNDRKRCKTKIERKRMTRELYELKKSCKKIWMQKNIGCKQMFIESLYQKIDSFILMNDMIGES